MVEIRNLSVVRDDSQALRQHCEKYHYLYRYPSPKSLPFGYRLVVNDGHYAPDGRLWGLVVMKKPQHHKHGGLFGMEGLPTAWQVLDLARVWINPILQNTRYNGHARCIFSQMVSKVLRRVQWDWLDRHPPVYPNLPYHIELIISYCEIKHHDGTAYRASNFRRWGLSRDRTMEVYYRKLKAPSKRWQPIQPRLELEW